MTPTVSTAAPIVIDQQDLSADGAVNFYFLAQTFTVGLQGNLVGVDVATFTDGPTEVVIYGTTAAGVPDLTNVLASVSLPILSVATQGAFGFQPTIFFSPIAVSPGDVLALAVLVPSSGGGTSNWNSDFFGGSYAGGAAFRSIGGAPLVGWQPLIVFGSEMDLLFRTYVDTGAAVAPVPEPATLSLLALGLAGVARRRLGAGPSRNATRRP